MPLNMNSSMFSKQYLAGFIDGEGCFNIARSGHYKDNYFPRLLIVNTNLEILKEIKEKYGGDITTRKNGKDNWKLFNGYRATGKTFKKIIKDVYPYLILKKDQANLCLQIIKNKDKFFRLKIKEQMNILNKKGI